MDSILTSVKKMLGIAESYEEFDQDIIMHINTVFGVLNQLGVGPEEGFTISDSSAVWTDFLGDTKLLETVKSYVYLKVRLLFDPPQNSSIMDSTGRLISELEWRINVTVDPGEEDDS